MPTNSTISEAKLLIKELLDNVKDQGYETLQGIHDGLTDDDVTFNLRIMYKWSAANHPDLPPIVVCDWLIEKSSWSKAKSAEFYKEYLGHHLTTHYAGDIWAEVYPSLSPKQVRRALEVARETIFQRSHIRKG